VRRPAALALALLAAACATAPPPVPLSGAEAGPFVEAWEKRRAEAYAPRRLKALYRGEAATKLGLSVRGYLAIYWDGTTLVWRTSVPLAGNVREGSLRRDGAAVGEASPFPAGLSAADVVGSLMGVLDLSAAGRPVARVGPDVRLSLDDAGREALLAPDGTRVTLEAASPFPARLAVKGPRGKARLALESWAAWPEGEAVPGEGA
jgi:hypothetical protein